MAGPANVSAELLLDLVGEAYAFDGLEEFRPGVMEVVNRAVPSAWVSYNEVGVEPDQVFSLMQPTFPSELFPAFVRYADQNPLIAEYRRTAIGRPRRISDLMGRAEYHRLDLYRECYSLIGVESQVAFTLPARPPLLLGIALSRGQEDFTDDEVELLARARPHLIQAYRNAELASARAATLHALEAGLDTVGSYVVVLDPHGRIEFATAHARRLVCRPGRNGSAALRAEIEAWLVNRRRQRGAVQPLVVNTRAGTALIRLLPQRSGDRRDLLLVEGGTGALTPEALRSLGLTSRQAESLQRIALGESPAVAAERMGIQRRTLDKHLQHVYAKLGVTTAHDAAATAWAAVGIRHDPA